MSYVLPYGGCGCRYVWGGWGLMRRCWDAGARGPDAFPALPARCVIWTLPWSGCRPSRLRRRCSRNASGGGIGCGAGGGSKSLLYLLDCFLPWRSPTWSKLLRGPWSDASRSWKAVTGIGCAGRCLAFFASVKKSGMTCAAPCVGGGICASWPWLGRSCRATRPPGCCYPRKRHWASCKIWRWYKRLSKTSLRDPSERNCWRAWPGNWLRTPGLPNRLSVTCVENSPTTDTATCRGSNPVCPARKPVRSSPARQRGC